VFERSFRVKVKKLQRKGAKPVNIGEEPRTGHGNNTSYPEGLLDSQWERC
jgi:hypothetical protein